MKHSYSFSFTAWIAEAKIKWHYINKKDNPVAAATSVNTVFPQLNINNRNRYSGLGIKFDNVSTEKYFVFIHPANQFPAVNKTTEKDDDFTRREPRYTENELVRIGEGNGPSVKC